MSCDMLFFFFFEQKCNPCVFPVGFNLSNRVYTQTSKCTRIFGLSHCLFSWLHCVDDYRYHIYGLVQEKRNSIANALKLRLSCTNPSICITAWDHFSFSYHVALWQCAHDIQRLCVDGFQVSFNYERVNNAQKDSCDIFMYETGGVITGMDSSNERRRHIFKSSRIGWNKTQNDFCEAISNKTEDTFGQVQRPLSNVILSTSTVLVSAENTTNQMLTLKISPFVNDNGKDSGLTHHIPTPHILTNF